MCWYPTILSKWSLAAESKQGKSTLEKVLKRLNAQNQALPKSLFGIWIEVTGFVLVISIAYSNGC